MYVNKHNKINIILKIFGFKLGCTFNRYLFLFFNSISQTYFLFICFLYGYLLKVWLQCNITI